MSLYTGKDINSVDWVELPIDNDVIKRVEEPVNIEKHTTFDQYKFFQWAPGIPIIYNMAENEYEESKKENSERNLIEESFEEIIEE